MWTTLTRQAQSARDQVIAELFDENAERACAFSRRGCGMYFDFSKTTITPEILRNLIGLAQEAHLERWREEMFAGGKINGSEGRAALHTALRAPAGAGPLLFEGEDVRVGIGVTLSRMADFCDDLRAGRITGAGGAFTDVVNIGIGGSDLGPAMAYKALAPYHNGPRVHFVSNVDGAHLTDTLATLDARRTLVIVASKSFTTIETMTNAQSARAWMEAGGGDPSGQFVALSSALAATGAFGIAPERVFGFEDWVGGRYSLWGPIGLSLMLAVGPAEFGEFLAGGALMDAHFREAPLLDNLPVLLALVGMWHHQFCQHPTRAVLPYDQRLELLPAYLQQLEMESNGKGVGRDGTPLAHVSAPIVWGTAGTNGQHAYYQLLHQGTQVVPCEFLVAAEGHEDALSHHHELLLANCLAQSEALMRGRSASEVSARLEAGGMPPQDAQTLARHRIFPGNRPSTTLIYPRLTPEVLGKIIALYEHRVFVEGIVLGINSFDQWGVELGKTLANRLAPLVADAEMGGSEELSGSTRALLHYIHQHRG